MKIIVHLICLLIPTGCPKKKSIFKDIIQLGIDHPPSYPIFDKLFLGAVAPLGLAMSIRPSVDTFEIWALSFSIKDIGYRIKAIGYNIHWIGLIVFKFKGLRL